MGMVSVQELEHLRGSWVTEDRCLNGLKLLLCPDHCSNFKTVRGNSKGCQSSGTEREID